MGYGARVILWRDPFSFGGFLTQISEYLMEKEARGGRVESFGFLFYNEREVLSRLLWEMADLGGIHFSHDYDWTDFLYGGYIPDFGQNVSHFPSSPPAPLPLYNPHPPSLSTQLPSTEIAPADPFYQLPQTE